MKNKGANNEECGDNHDVRLMYMMRAKSHMSLSKCYQYVLTIESVR